MRAFGNFCLQSLNHWVQVRKSIFIIDSYVVITERTHIYSAGPPAASSASTPRGTTRRRPWSGEKIGTGRKSTVRQATLNAMRKHLNRDPTLSARQLKALMPDLQHLATRSIQNICHKTLALLSSASTCGTWWIWCRGGCRWSRREGAMPPNASQRALYVIFAFSDLKSNKQLRFKRFFYWPVIFYCGYCIFG